MMKKAIVAVLLFFAAAQFTKAQTKVAMGPAVKKMNDSLCNCMSKVDFDKIHNGKDAESAFSDCFTKHADLLVDVAAEKKISITDDTAMNKLGEEIGKNLMSENCSAAVKLGVKMAANDDQPETSTTEGVFKRIDLKGFNYLVIKDAGNSEKSFLWLRQFTGSEGFMTDAAKMIGKKVKVTWQEIEVYVPEAKGYYKVKEITGVDVL